MSQPIRPLFIIVKALILFVLFNLVFAVANLPYGKLSVYNHLVPGRQRFPFEKQPERYPLGHNLPILENFEAMFASHEITAGSKPFNEYRVIFLGDSSIWGFDLSVQDTLSEQINRQNLRTCDGRRLHAYNLGYPFSFALRDLLIFEEARQYQPDLLVWFVTKDTFIYTTPKMRLLSEHKAQTFGLAQKYAIGLEPKAFTSPVFLDGTIIGQRAVLKKTILLQLHGFGWAATGIDFHLEPEEAKSKAVTGLPELEPGDLRPSLADQEALSQKLQLGTIAAFYSEAGGLPFVIVNQPVHSRDGEYDLYRQALADYLQGKGPYYDLWNAVPTEGFRSELHLSAAGEGLLADLLAPAMLEMACP